MTDDYGVNVPALAPGAEAILADLPPLDTLTDRASIASALQCVDAALTAQRIYVADGTAPGDDPAQHPGSRGIDLILTAGADLVDAYDAQPTA